MEYCMIQIKQFAHGILFALVLCVVTSLQVQATETGVDMSQFVMEITASDITYTVQSGDGAYEVTLAPNTMEGFLYGFYRQALDWQGEAGIALALTNDSEETLYLSVQLIDADWQGISLPEGTAVLLQGDGEEDYTVAFVSQDVFAVPAQFQGEIFLPLVAEDDILAALQGFGITFAPNGNTVVTLQGLTFWEDEIAQMQNTLGTATLQLQDSALCIPQLGENMTVATVVGVGSERHITYALANPTTGATIDQSGRIMVDATVDATELVVQATVDQQMVLETPLYLYTVWDIMADEDALEDFALLDQSNYSNKGNYPLIETITTYIFPLQIVCIGAGLLILATYVLWRRGARKP